MCVQLRKGCDSLFLRKMLQDWLFFTGMTQISREKTKYSTNFYLVLTMLFYNADK